MGYPPAVRHDEQADNRGSHDAASIVGYPKKGVPGVKVFNNTVSRLVTRSVVGGSDIMFYLR